MSPVVKYTLGRLGMFVVLLAVLLPIPYPENFFVKAMIALFASAGLSYVLMGRWRTEMAEQLASVADRRRAEKDRLRAALAGDETAAAEGDRAAKPASGPAKPIDGSAG
jgi:cytochrome c-type biogenesis protein CcmH/NrfG